MFTSMWADNTRNVVDYTGILPENRVFHWGEIGKFPPNKNILMHKRPSTAPRCCAPAAWNCPKHTLLRG